LSDLAQEQADFDYSFNSYEVVEGVAVTIGGSNGISDPELAAAAERQLAALMDLGFHAELVVPLCDGVTAVEDLVETLATTMADEEHSTAFKAAQVQSTCCTLS